MTEEICPVCDCSIGPEIVENEGVSYCCDPCAEGRPGECVTCASSGD